MIYGYNVLKVDDKARLLDNIRKLKPLAMLFYNDQLDFAKQVQAEFPTMTVLYRQWPDGEPHKKYTPSQWLDKYATPATKDLMLYTSNESGLGDDLITWTISLMNLCVARKQKLCILNPATGTWNVGDMPRLRALLELAGKHPDLFVLGLHEYAGGVITSGIRGGFPSHAGVDPNGPDKDKGANLIPRDNWPQPPGVFAETKFHVGRHEWILNYCKAQGIKPPRIGLTECGFDFLGDIGNWLLKIGQESGQVSVNGWRTLVDTWRKWWPDISPEMAYVKQWEYAEKALLTGVEFALFFAYGDDGSWANYNIANSAIPALLEATRVSDPPVPTPIPAPPLPPPPPLPPIVDPAEERMRKQSYLLKLAAISRLLEQLRDEILADLNKQDKDAA